MKALVNFYAAVSEPTVNDLILNITKLVAAGSNNPKNPLDEIIIQISSSGGSSDHGLLAYNFLSQLNVPKTTIGMGNVDSAAVMIFAAGDKRLSMPSCRFLLHEALTTITNGTFNATKLKEIASLNERITKDYCKVVGKVTGKPLKTILEKVKEGHVMSADEAKKYGLVEEIQQEPYLTDLSGLNIVLINTPKKTAAPTSRNSEVEI